MHTFDKTLDEARDRLRDAATSRRSAFFLAVVIAGVTAAAVWDKWETPSARKARESAERKAAAAALQTLQK